MTQCVQYFDQITAYAQLVTVASVVCTICWGVLIWCAIKVRKAALQVQEAQRWLVEPRFNAGLANAARANDTLKEQIEANEAKETEK